MDPQAARKGCSHCSGCCVSPFTGPGPVICRISPSSTARSILGRSQLRIASSVHPRVYSYHGKSRRWTCIVRSECHGRPATSSYKHLQTDVIRGILQSACTIWLYILGLFFNHPSGQLIGSLRTVKQISGCSSYRIN